MLILEVVHWNIKEGQEIEFELAFAEAQKILISITGYVSHRFQKCIENPKRYILLVEWKKLEDHTEGFQKSHKYEDDKKLITPFIEPGTSLEHFNMVSRNTL